MRKSVGDDIGKQAFIAWLSAQSAGIKAEADTNAQIIVDALWPLVREGTLAIPRGGYLIRLAAANLSGHYDPRLRGVYKRL